MLQQAIIGRDTFDAPDTSALEAMHQRAVCLQHPASNAPVRDPVKMHSITLAVTNQDKPRTIPPAITSSNQAPNLPLPQLDGPPDYRSQPIPAPMPQSANPSRAGPTPKPQTTTTPKTAIGDLLPFCTAETPLDEEQVVALSDVAGCLREVMILALRAKADERVARVLTGALGVDGVRGVVDFWSEEYEI